MSIDNLSLNVIQINRQYIRNELQELEHLCSIHHIDIVCLAEHCLILEQSELFLPSQYIMCRFSLEKIVESLFIETS